MLALWRVVHDSRPGPVEERAGPFGLERVGEAPRHTFRIRCRSAHRPFDRARTIQRRDNPNHLDDAVSFHGDGAEGQLTAAAKCDDDEPFGGERSPGPHIVNLRDHAPCRLVVGPNLNGNNTLTGGWYAQIHGQRRRDPGAQAETAQPGAGENEGLHLSAIKPRQPRIHIASNW